VGKTLVTGATGFAGNNLCRRLVQDGTQIVAFVRPTSHYRELVNLGIECRKVDIKDIASIQDNFSGITKVYHLAAEYRIEHSDKDEFTLVNIEGTRNLLKAAKAAKVKRFVHCSTVGVQGVIDDPPADENYRFNPGDHYQESKLQGELLARDYFSKGLPGVVVRPVGLYGAGDSRFLKLFKPISRGYFVMIGHGNVLYHITYIDDFVDGMVLCGIKPEALGEVFTIAGEKYTTIRELVNMIADVLGEPHPKWHIPLFPVYMAAKICEGICRRIGVNPPLYPRRVEFFCLDRAFSIEKAKRLLGYKPKVELKKGLATAASWYKEQGLI
jgi:nucleoside-diphosphate-sugar epimerase